MSIDLAVLPRAAVTGYLRALRLPLDAVQAVALRGDGDGQARASEWPPAVAFDAFEAKVKGLAASVLRDDELRRDASVQQAKVTQLRRAATLEAEAGARRARADEEFEARRRTAAQEAAEATERAEAEERRLEQKKAETKQRVRRQAAQKERKVRQSARAEQEKVDAAERAAEADRLEAEKVALQEGKEAVEATGAAHRLDKAADSARRRRKSQS